MSFPYNELKWLAKNKPTKTTEMTKENVFKKHPLSKKLQKEILQRDIDKVKAGTHKWVTDLKQRCKKLVRIK